MLVYDMIEQVEVAEKPSVLRRVCLIIIIIYTGQADDVTLRVDVCALSDDTSVDSQQWRLFFLHAVVALS